MKVRVMKVKPSGDKEAVMVKAKSVSIEVPDHDDYVLEAQVDDGDCPIRIHLDNGKTAGVKNLRLTNASTRTVKSYKVRGRGPYMVGTHQRPLRHHSEQTRARISAAMKAVYAEKRLRARFEGVPMRKKKPTALLPMREAQA
ncbi:hypothetical protein [Nitrospira sp. Nam74]